MILDWETAQDALASFRLLCLHTCCSDGALTCTCLQRLQHAACLLIHSCLPFTTALFSLLANFSFFFVYRFNEPFWERGFGSRTDRAGVKGV